MKRIICIHPVNYVSYLILTKKATLLYFTELRNGWLIRTASKSFAVYAATSTEKQEWMAHINKCIEDRSAANDS